MRLEWDESKNRTNYRKHGVWFEEAQTVWADPRSMEFFDPEHSEEEDRFLRIGYSDWRPIAVDRFLRTGIWRRDLPDLCS